MDAIDIFPLFGGGGGGGPRVTSDETIEMDPNSCAGDLSSGTAKDVASKVVCALVALATLAASLISFSCTAVASATSASCLAAAAFLDASSSKRDRNIL